MGITCVSETKWFCNDVYEVDGFTVLCSGRDLPRSGKTLQRGEGVAICLDPVGWQDARRCGWQLVQKLCPLICSSSLVTLTVLGISCMCQLSVFMHPPTELQLR